LNCFDLMGRAFARVKDRGPVILMREIEREHLARSTNASACLNAGRRSEMDGADLFVIAEDPQRRRRGRFADRRQAILVGTSRPDLMGGAGGVGVAAGRGIAGAWTGPRGGAAGMMFSLMALGAAFVLWEPFFLATSGALGRGRDVFGPLLHRFFWFFNHHGSPYKFPGFCRRGAASTF